MKKIEKKGSMDLIGGFMRKILVVFILLGSIVIGQEYSWKKDYQTAQSLEVLVPPPNGYKRIAPIKGSFAEWLRKLPVRENDSVVYLYDGRQKANQSAQFLVLDIDVGQRNLQQCADAVMRLRAEYLYSQKKYDAISFNFTSGDACRYSEWVKGKRPNIKGNTIQWLNSGKTGYEYREFRKYLNTVFTYAGTYSLMKELKANPIKDLAAGDVFIQGGFPGHAMLVGDVAIEPSSGKKVFILIQSYMPAQDLHIVKNPQNSDLSPWFPLEFGQKLVTPEWVFNADDLRKFD